MDLGDWWENSSHLDIVVRAKVHACKRWVEESFDLVIRAWAWYNIFWEELKSKHACKKKRKIKYIERLDNLEEDWKMIA
jgi:hypothetical protein